MSSHATPPFDDDDFGSGDPLSLPPRRPDEARVPSAAPPPHPDWLPPGAHLIESHQADPAPYVSNTRNPNQNPGWRSHIRRILPLRRKRWWAARIAATFAVVFVLLIGWLAVTAPLSKSLKPISPPEITLLAADGTPIARNGSIVAAPVEIAKLPKTVPEAFIAIEDRRFYEHWGIDYRGMARAAWVNMTSGRTEGGSTITQQLAKFTFLTPERSLTRKLREAMIAYWLEAWLTKNQILERYLSNAYFGDNTYGLRAASEHYFSREPETLTLAQSAMLGGLMQAPSRYAPTSNYPLAERRMRQVLAAMAREGYITAAQAKNTPSPRLHVRRESEIPTGTYFADWALPQARSVGEGGYASETFKTTLDSRLQAAARSAIARAPLGKAQVALVAMRPNGEVVAMIGGTDYAASPFNRVTQAQRQPGSTFKLFVYLTAIRQGWKPGDTIDDTEIKTGVYRPKNASGTYARTITLEDAFARSSNVAAVRLFQKVGDKAVIQTARDLGITAPLPQGDPSLPLGTSTMTLLELTSAYAGVAANSFPVEPRAFPAPEQGWLDKVLDRHKALTDAQHDAIERLLRGVIDKGTGRAARLSHTAYGKTGTTQDNRDALFVGYAGGLVVGVWVGNDDNTPLAGVHGGSVPARIWHDFMRTALGESAAPPPSRQADPDGPVQPLDLPDLSVPGADGAPDTAPAGAAPIGMGNQLHVGGGAATFSTQIGGQPLDVKLDHNGLTLSGPDARATQIPAQAASQAVRDAAAQAKSAAQRLQAEVEKQMGSQGPVSPKN